MVGCGLSGTKTRLRETSDDDLLRRVGWLSDPETVKLFTGSESVRSYQLTDAVSWRQSLESDAQAMVWSIDTLYGRHIGDVDLHHIDKVHKFAKLTILIGDKDYWGKGYGSDAILTLLRYAFDALDLESVDLRVYDFNTRGIECYKKCGFKQIGSSYPDRENGPPEIYMVATKRSLPTDNLNAVQD
ncbi:MAG: GNAT family N-acetyltransferase [Armatimonadota bacterium]